MTSPDSAIAIHNLSFAWKQDSAPLLSIDQFVVARGERVFLAGPSGSGKTTLLNLLGGVLRPNTGTVSILGTALETLSARRRDAFRADHIGFVFQLFNLVPYLSVLDNVMLPCQFSRRRMSQIEESMQEAGTRLVRALGLDQAELLTRPAHELSIGQQQRVAAARALIGQPEILIADEPTSALDEATRERYLELLFRQCESQRTTLLFVSHDERLGALFDRNIDLSEINKSAAPEDGST